MWEVVAALVPSIGVCALFVFVVRKMISADRDERAAQARMDLEERRRGTQSSGAPVPSAAADEVPRPVRDDPRA